MRHVEVDRRDRARGAGGEREMKPVRFERVEQGVQTRLDRNAVRFDLALHPFGDERGAFLGRDPCAEQLRKDAQVVRVVAAERAQHPVHRKVDAGLGSDVFILNFYEMPYCIVL